MSSKYIKISEVQESGGFSSGEKYYRSKCYQYEEDIQILQQKLMQTHSKLMDQIDKSRQLQEQVNQLIQQQLTKENINSSHSSHSKPNKRSEEMIEKEQLKNDLQVMRNKILGEIYKNNKLKQNQKQILAKHSEQVAIYIEKNKELQNLLCDYQQEVEELKQANEKLKQKALKKKKQTQDQKPQQCSCGYEKKYYELDRAFMNQRSLTNELIEENNSLQNQLHEQKIKLTVLSKNQEKCVHNAYKKSKSNKKIKRHNFQSTKNLIKQLEEEEREIRSKILQ